MTKFTPEFIAEKRWLLQNGLIQTDNMLTIEALDEIERLRDENKRLRNAIVLAVYYMKLDNRYMVFKCLINALEDEVTHD